MRCRRSSGSAVAVGGAVAAVFVDFGMGFGEGGEGCLFVSLFVGCYHHDHHDDHHDPLLAFVGTHPPVASLPPPPPPTWKAGDEYKPRRWRARRR